MLNPVDPTTTPAWKRLTELHDSMTPDLRAWFADDPQRAERFSYEVGDLFVDLSKNFLTDEVRDTLARLAEAVDVLELCFLRQGTPYPATPAVGSRVATEAPAKTRSERYSGSARPASPPR